jgi:hypothetical protein
MFCEDKPVLDSRPEYKRVLMWVIERVIGVLHANAINIGNKLKVKVQLTSP